jgi:hypothetical protein
MPESAGILPELAPPHQVLHVLNLGEPPQQKSRRRRLRQPQQPSPVSFMTLSFFIGIGRDE